MHRSSRMENCEAFTFHKQSRHAKVNTSDTSVGAPSVYHVSHRVIIYLCSSVSQLARTVCTRLTLHCTFTGDPRYSIPQLFSLLQHNSQLPHLISNSATTLSTPHQFYTYPQQPHKPHFRSHHDSQTPPQKQSRNKSSRHSMRLNAPRHRSDRHRPQNTPQRAQEKGSLTNTQRVSLARSHIPSRCSH